MTIKTNVQSELSGGTRQRVALMGIYVLRRIILLDEPFSALRCNNKISLHSWYLDI